MAESTLSIEYDDLAIEVAAFLGYDTSSGNRTTAENAEVDRYIQAGVRQFYYPPAVQGVEAGYKWSFLSPIAEITTTEDDGDQDLPDDVGRVVGNFYYDADQYKKAVVQTNEAKVLSLLQHSDSSAPPQVAAIRYKAQDVGSGQRLEVLWWPVPDSIYTLTYKYEAYVGKIDSNTNPHPLGGMRYAEVIVESCLSIAEQRANDEQGVHTQAFMRQLAASIQQDRKQFGVNYGQMGGAEDASMPRHAYLGLNYPITYKGDTW